MPIYKCAWNVHRTSEPLNSSRCFAGAEKKLSPLGFPSLSSPTLGHQTSSPTLGHQTTALRKTKIKKTI